MADLTICLPTRNRQRYCIETIRAIAASDAQDFEVIVADNSDDGSILARFFADEFEDDRFRLLAPSDRVLSMVDNWERTMEQASGRWISFIGDDDYIDPRVTGLIRRYERLYPDVEAVSWNRMSFNWPDNRPTATLASVPISFATVVANKADLQERLFRWSEGRRRPAAGFGIYHGAIKRGLMERIKRKFGGRYFEHPNVDYENCCKVIAAGKTLVHCQRPFSVLGACAASNSAGAQSLQVMMERTRIFLAETTDNVPTEHPDFPFPISDNSVSICVSVAHTTFWFCTTYGHDLTGFPENFARAAMDECAFARSEEEHAIKTTAFRRGFAAWEGGKWAELFDPKPYPPGERTINEVSGLIAEMLYLREKLVEAETPGSFYQFAEHAILPVEHVVSGARTFAR